MVFDEGKTAKKALTLLDSLIADLDSPELVEKVEMEILGLSDVLPVTKLRRGHTIRNGDFGAHHVAKAAINVIKGQITATRDREQWDEAKIF